MNDEMFSFSEFEKFLNDLPNLGLVNEATARNLRDASTRLLATHEAGFDEDVRDLDIDVVVNQYSETSGVEVSNASLQSYKSRLSSAIKKFIDYQKDVFGDDDQAEVTNTFKKKRNQKKTSTSSMGAMPSEVNDIKTFDLPIPIRDGLILTVGKMPLDLTNDEAERIATIIKSFAVK